MAQNVGTLISAAIRPNDSLDPIASAFASEIKGGLHTATSSIDRDSIIFERREWGMMCYVTNDDKTYQLTYGYTDTNILNNLNWKEFSGSGSGGGGEWIDSVLSFQNSEPIGPTDGDRYIVGPSPTGSPTWTSFTSDLVVQWSSILGIWETTTPVEGMTVRVDNLDNAIYKYSGTFPSGAWQTEKLNLVRYVNFTTANGASYSTTTTPVIDGYTNDVIFLSQFSSTNTGSTVSLNVNGLGEVQLKKASNSGLVSLNPNDIKSGVVYSLLYDGTYFQISNPANESLFNIKHYVEAGDYIIVPQYYQYWVYGDLEVVGTLINYGHVIVANGSMVMSGGTFSNYGSFALVSLSSGGTSSGPSFSNTSTIEFFTSNTIYGLSVTASVVDNSLTSNKLDTSSNGGATAGYFLSVDSSGYFSWVSSNLNAGDGLYLVGSNINVNTGTGMTISSNQVSLTNTGVTAGSYGDSNSYPILIVDSQGRLTSVYTQSVAQSLNAGDGLIQIGNDFVVNTGTGLTISSDQVLLTNTGVTAGSYGDSNSYPVITVDSQGRLTSVYTQSVAQSLNAGDGLIQIGNDFVVNTGAGLTISSDQVLLTNTGVTAGSYGDSSSYPVITVDSQGRLTSVYTQSVAQSLNAGDGLIQIGNDFVVNTGTGLTISSDQVILTDTGATAGYYGNSYSYPVFSVDSQGRITDIATQSIDLSGGSTVIAIGPAEDGTYTDGIFTDFTPSTPIGTAIDRFNEMLLLLAPTPPSNWNNAITSISFTSTSYSARTLVSGTPVTIYIDTTPDLTDVDSVGTQANAKIDTTGLTFSLVDNGVTIETVTLSGTATPLKNTGNIRHSASGDPYIGISGKAGFWTGITDFSLAGSLPTITASSSQRTLQLFHPGTDSPETFNYYIDAPLTVSIGSITASVPSMTSYISGVPTLTTSQTVTSIGFSVSNVSSYFYAATSVYQINAGLIAGSTGDPDSVPSLYGQTGNVSGKSGTIQSNQFSDLTFTFTARGRNSIGTYGSNTTFTSTNHRVDTVSNESSRITSGSGNYPSSGYNGVYDSTQSLVGAYTEELQLRNGLYVYPSVDYTSVGGPNYSGASGTRWVTFNLGTFTSNSAFTLTINGSSGITSIGQANLLIEVKIDGATSWVDGDSAYAGVGNPGSGVDGVAACVIASSTATSRRITFGSVTYSGSIIVRIGFTGSGPQFTSLTAGSIV